jgi:hypothetical protein
MNRLFVLILLCAVSSASAMPKLDGSPFQGEVLESVNAGSYTYLRLKTADGEVWAAIMQTDMPKGTKVQLHDPMLMTNFESKAMGRTFDQIVFASAVSTETSSVATPAQQMAAAHKGAATGATSAPVEKVTKAAGADARTVAEVYAQKTQLKGKGVAVRGKVVKFTPDILGKNWVHLRDGSGSASGGDNDLLVTTAATAKVGDVLVARGVVRLDANYGSGYAYPVVVEGATLKP